MRDGALGLPLGRVSFWLDWVHWDWLDWIGVFFLNFGFGRPMLVGFFIPKSPILGSEASQLVQECVQQYVAISVSLFLRGSRLRIPEEILGWGT